jgi:hypothetical protein
LKTVSDQLKINVGFRPGWTTRWRVSDFLAFDHLLSATLTWDMCKAQDQSGHRN